MAVTETLSVSDAAVATGVSAHTLRYDERAGLIDPVGRAGSSIAATRGLRSNGSSSSKLRSTGMPIRRMRDYADLVRRGDGYEAERLALLEEHRVNVRAQLEEAARNVRAIDTKIEIYKERITGNGSHLSREPGAHRVPSGARLHGHVGVLRGR